MFRISQVSRRLEVGNHKRCALNTRQSSSFSAEIRMSHGPCCLIDVASSDDSYFVFDGSGPLLLNRNVVHVVVFGRRVEVVSSPRMEKSYSDRSRTG